MNIAIRAAIAILSIASIGTAYADSEGGQNANTLFTQTPGFLAQGAGAERPGCRNCAERADGAGLCHPVEPRYVAVPALPRQRLIPHTVVAERPASLPPFFVGATNRRPCVRYSRLMPACRNSVAQCPSMC
jgi:hypothetical protein